MIRGNKLVTLRLHLGKKGYFFFRYGKFFGMQGGGGVADTPWNKRVRYIVTLEQLSYENFLQTFRQKYVSTRLSYIG